MKIHLETYPLLDNKLTGIGYYEKGLVSALMRLYPEHEYVFDAYKTNAREQLNALDVTFASAEINQNNLPRKIYRALFPFVSLAGDKNKSVSMYFNYICPPGKVGKKIVVVHDMGYKAYPETVRARTRAMLNFTLGMSIRRADLIVTDSLFSKSEIIKYFPKSEDKIRTIYCGIDGNRFNTIENLGLKADNLKEKYGIKGEYFLYVGTIEPRKNILRLIEAYKQLTTAGFKFSTDNYNLVLAGGKGWMCNEIIETARNTPGVLLLDYVPHEDVPVLMRSCKAFVFPSLYEGFGMPPLEAMACGARIVASDISVLCEVTGGNAIYCNPHDVTSIAKALEDVLHEDDSKKEKARVNGLDWVKKFTWENSAEQMIQILSE